MRTYRACWWAAVLLVGGPGFVTAVLTEPVGDLLVRGFGGALVGLASHLVIVELVRQPAALPGASSSAVAGSVSLVAAVGATALVGEGAVLLLALLLALTSPGACRCCSILLAARTRPTGGRNGSPSPKPVEDASPLLTAVMVRQLSDEELAAAWHFSCGALQRVADPSRRLSWVLAREAYLDEFQRRSPEIFSGWLAGSAGTTEPSRQCFPQPLTDPSSDAG